MPAAPRPTAILPVFALLCGSAIAAPPGGGDPRLSNELHPSWSPDGKRIVFQSDRSGRPNLYLFDLAKDEARRLTDAPAEDASPVWSPDGRWIAFHSDRRGNFDLWVIRPDGTGLRRLTSGERDETSAAWSPESTRLVYEERADHQAWHLRVVDLETLATRPLLSEPGSHLTPSWMATGRIAYSYSPPGGNHDSDIVLRVVDPEGNDGGELLGGRRGNSNVQYSPARDRIVYNSTRDGDWEIYSSTFDGGDERRWTTSGGDGLVGIDGQPDWSPAGDRVAITSGRAGSLDLLVLSDDGGEPRNLTASWTKDP